MERAREDGLRRTKAPALLDDLKAWLWSHAEITSLTCKLHDVDAAAYLHAAVVAADRGELVLPWSFAAAK